MTPPRPLAGICIAVTRPRESGAALAAMIEAAGGTAIVFPTLEIGEPGDRARLDAVLDRLDEFDLAIFISPNAVRRGVEAARARRTDRAWPERLRVAAIGEGTRRELARHGFPSVIAPDGRADSEALLARAELAEVRGKAVVIFRGEGGRALLADALRARGAQVTLAECYRRLRPRSRPDALLSAWESGALRAVAVSSGEGLANLCAMIGERGVARLRATALFVPHPRIAAQARELGVREVQLSSPGDEEMLAALVAYFSRGR